MPADPAQLIEAAIHGAVVIDLPGRTHLELTGQDRASFLHNFCSNHIKGLAVGQGCEAFITSIKGRILGHVLVFADVDRLLVETVPGQGPALLAHLDKYIITEDVQLADRSGEWSQLSLSGARAEELLQAALSLTALPSGTAPAQISVGNGFLRKFSFGSAPGWSLAGPRDWISQCQASLLAAGALAGPEELFEQLRIEAGFPHYGVDLSEAHLAQEANRNARAISFQKGCYLGQEPIARIDALGHVNRALCSVITTSALSISAGADVFASAEATEPAGQLSSAIVWPTTGQTIGIGILRRELAVEGKACWLGPERALATVRVR
jgi:folate-binding protein YgfZ